MCDLQCLSKYPRSYFFSMLELFVFQIFKDHVFVCFPDHVLPDWDRGEPGVEGILGRLQRGLHSLCQGTFQNHWWRNLSMGQILVMVAEIGWLTAGPLMERLCCCRWCWSCTCAGLDCWGWGPAPVGAGLSPRSCRQLGGGLGIVRSDWARPAMLSTLQVGNHKMIRVCVSRIPQVSWEPD